MKKELRDIATEASSNLGWWQPWQFVEQVGPKEAAFIAAMSPQIAIEILDENESMRKQLDAMPEIVDRLVVECNVLSAAVLSGKAAAINDMLRLEQKERDWLTTSQETDETIATLKQDNATMKSALLDVIKVLESDDPAISDTVWVSTGQPETLRDHCHHAVYGYMYEGEERA